MTDRQTDTCTNNNAGREKIDKLQTSTCKSGIDNKKEQEGG